MVGLSISPLQGLMTFWFTSGNILFIPSGLKKMTRIMKCNQSQRNDIFAEYKVYSTKTNPEGMKLL
jgi:hypothetical protein